MSLRIVGPAVLALALALGGGAYAQTAPTAPSDNNAVNTAPQNNPGAPVSGANSFTEGQAKSRIGDAGYADVAELKQDPQGVWRGKAMRDGKSVEVAMDYQGNVTSK